MKVKEHICAYGGRLLILESIICIANNIFEETKYLFVNDIVRYLKSNEDQSPERVLKDYKLKFERDNLRGS